MKVLVTGAEGYIGSRLVPLLVVRGLNVAPVDAGFYTDAQLYADSLSKPPTRVVDIRDLTTTDLRGFDAVVHLAELSNDPLGELNPQLTERINHLGSVSLANAARQAGVRRFVYTSSCSVYGAAGDGRPRTEDSDTNPQTAYARCKVMVERDVVKLASPDFTPVFLRNATVYGPSPRMRFDIVLNNLAGVAFTTGRISMTSDGTPLRPMVHVDDVCAAIAEALLTPADDVRGQIVNVGSDPQNYTVRQIAEAVKRRLPHCQLEFGNQDADNRSYRVSFTKIGQVLPNFCCRYTIDDGARQLIETFERIQLTPDTFRHRCFTRLKQLQHLMDTKQVDVELRRI